MRIVALHTDFRIYWPARLKALKDFLYSKGHTLDIIEIAGKGSHYEFAEKEDSSSLPWHILFPESRPEDLSGSRIKPLLFKKLNAIRPDVIIAGAIAFPSGALAVAWGQKNKARVIIFDDAKTEAVRRNGLTNFIKRAVYQGVDAMLYPAPDWIPTGQFWGFSEEQLFYGVDVVDNAFWEKKRDNCPIDGDFMVAVGRQIPKKGFITLLQAYSLYLKTTKATAYKLVLIGDGPEHQALVDYIQENKLDKHVQRIPFLSQEELAEIYQRAKCLICSSNNQETWGLVINEAMACGCPIIASNECGATHTLVQDGINGFRFSYGDIKELSDKIAALHQLDTKSHLAMCQASKIIIADWGLERFCQGCYDAILYATNHKKRKASLLQRTIISIWKGRYRPV